MTTATIGQTICVPGYTKLVRPAASYTSGVKLKLLRERGEPAENAALYELDHVVPLTLGGHPRALDNLRLQAWAEATRKDRLEAKLGCMVCSGQAGLDEARRAIVVDWEAAYHRYAPIKCERSVSLAGPCGEPRIRLRTPSVFDYFSGTLMAGPSSNRLSRSIPRRRHIPSTFEMRLAGPPKETR